MRETIALNFNWLFNKEHLDEHIKDFHNTLGFEKVDLPHNAVDIPFNYFDEKMTQIICTYKKEIFIKEDWRDKIINIIFEGVSNIANIFIDDEFVMTHKGGYTQFTVNISEYVKYGQTNMLTVVVDSHENVFVPPFGGVVDYLGYSGIYREVSMQILEKAHISDCTIKTIDPVNSSIASINLDLSVNYGTIEISLLDKDQEVVNTKVTINDNHVEVKVDMGNKVLWDIDNPYLYYAQIKFYQDDNLCDQIKRRFGFREVAFKNDGFYLNQKEIKLRGLNRHQSYPYVGYAMPKRVQADDADILKYQLGCNIVRTSHYPQSLHFLNRCDEIGLLVFEEIPGWQHIGNSEWQELSYQNVKDMIKRDKNHPSIIMWGVRINESPDSHLFYNKTNEIAHKLDDTRPTGGVRNIDNSDFLEDVYTYNDFIHHGTNKGLESAHRITRKKVPYLVTEYNGHMFPTKRYDDELHRLDHALRHLKVINAMQRENNHISGAIGWSMNDYNTHQEFGSGDRVCYHGVLDMFRIPKLASYVYSSQQDQIPVLEVSSTMNSGEYPASDLNKIYIFTNCDYIKLYRNNEFIKTFYPSSLYKNVKHPSIIIDDFIGELLEKHENLTPKDSNICKKILKAVGKYGAKLPLTYKLRVLYILQKYHLSYDDGVKMFYKYIGGWGGKSLSYRFDGYINDQKVKSVTKENGYEFNYEIEIQRKTLEITDTYDATKVIVKKVNQTGDISAYSFDPLLINVSGSIELIGPNMINLQGGIIAFWVKTNGNQGIGNIEVSFNDKHLLETVMVK